MRIIKNGLKDIFSISIVAMLFTALGCKNGVDQEISQIEIDLQIDRFDKKFVDIKNYSLGDLKMDYPFLFNSRVNDSIWNAKRNDSLFLLLQEEVQRVFPETTQIEQSIKNLFKHIRFYFPDKKIPNRTIVIISDIDYDTKAVYRDTISILSLDTFLGTENVIYQGIYEYLKISMNKDYIPVEMAREFAKNTIPPPTQRSFVAKMVYHGKILYLLDLLLPEVPNHMLLTYNQEQHQWVNRNQRDIWYYFLEKELLFSTQNDLGRRFLANAPFSKFYLEIDTESAPRVGQWLGWQIVKSYTVNFPATDLSELLSMDETQLFMKSNYKPKK